VAAPAGQPLEALVWDELRGPVSELVRKVVVELVREQLNGPVRDQKSQLAVVRTPERRAGAFDSCPAHPSGSMCRSRSGALVVLR
jgi:hypothetical protein